MKIIISVIITFIIACAFIKAGFVNFNLAFHKKRIVRKWYIFFICVICTGCVIGIYDGLVDISANYYYNKEFVLDSSDKYIIHWNINNLSPDEMTHIYYETDFEENEITMKEENEDDTFFYHGIVEKQYYNEIKEIIENVTSNEKNLIEITLDEKLDYYYKVEKRYSFYTIETHDGKMYHVKDINQMKRLDELLKKHKNYIY